MIQERKPLPENYRARVQLRDKRGHKERELDVIGESHEHTNQIEGGTFYDFHIHHATERYQESGAREDAFAEVTDRYADFHSALRCMFEDCGFEAPQEVQPSLFGEFDV
jgi:hypothetical protein